MTLRECVAHRICGLHPEEEGMLRFLKLLLVLSPTIALSVAAVWFFTRPAPVEVQQPSRLLVLVIFDQMRGDYLERWVAAFGPDGFERMKKEGTWYANCLLPYACTATAPGHASLVTGASPSVHGIIENARYDRSSGKLLTTFLDETRTPPMLSPTQLLAPSLSGSLKAATDGRGKYFSLSLKDRSAVLMGGKEATNIFCFDNGRFHTSSYYSEPPAWVDKFNEGSESARFAGQVWNRFSSANYDSLAGKDDQEGEYPPRTLPKTLPAVSAQYYRELEASPFGNELVWSFAKTAIEAEKLGDRNTTDILALSFSSNDLVGHAYGPDSHEVLDITLRSDDLVARMIAYLDAALGRDRYTLVVTADHGVAPLTEVVSNRIEARRSHPGELVKGFDDALDDAFGKVNNVPGRWLEGNFKGTYPWVYLNRRLIESLGVPFDAVEAFSAKWLANRDGVVTVFRRTKLEEGICLPEEKPMFDLVRNAFHKERSGDLCIVPKPHWAFTTALGVDHGSLHDYDRQVFILALGAGVPVKGKQSAPLNWLSITPMVCKTIRINPPAKSTKQLPEGW